MFHGTGQTLCFICLEANSIRSSIHDPQKHRYGLSHRSLPARLIYKHERSNETNGMRFLDRLIPILALALLIVGIGSSQQALNGAIWERLLQDAYTAHLGRVQSMLPPHSGLPPLLDLSQSNPSQTVKDLDWEDRFKGTMDTRVIADPGVPGPSQATSVSTTFIDTVGRPSALPARSCEAVVIARPWQALLVSLIPTRTFFPASPWKYRAYSKQTKE